MSKYKQPWQDKLDYWDCTATTMKSMEQDRYDQGARLLPLLRTAQEIQIEDHISKNWDPKRLIVSVGNDATIKSNHLAVTCSAQTKGF